MSAPDPLPALVAERMKICVLRGAPAGHSDDEMKALNGQVGVFDNRIADIVAPSADGILAQFELLMELTDEGTDRWSDNRDRRLMEAIKTGLGNLTGDAKISAPVPFALGGQPDADELVLSLFRQWIAVCGEVDALVEAETETTDDERNPYRRWNEIEEEIMTTPGGAVALAIKAYICIRQSHDGGSWSSHTATLRLNEDHRDNVDYEASVLRNAAALVPEIGELAAAIIHEDAELIDLDMEVTWARVALAGSRPLWDWRREKDWRRETEAKLAEALNQIAQAEAKTERGEAIKARHAPR
jgi:hypothetical protein